MNAESAENGVNVKEIRGGREKDREETNIVSSETEFLEIKDNRST